MEKLEQYLDQVCRSIGGPVEMREHVRQELREHLLDAVAQHKAAGLSEDDALKKAFEEFGKPDEVRTELEATHGQRTTWLIDKAMQWKEKTMKARWLWTTWAYLMLATVIALEVCCITFAVLFIVPKFERLMRDGMIDSREMEHHNVMWLVNFLFHVSYLGSHHTWLLVLVPSVLWGLFEWRVKSDNKSFMRLSALGTLAVGLMVVVALTAAAMLISFCLAMPVMGILSRPWAVERVAGIETALGGLEKARANKDWEAMQKHTDLIRGGANALLIGPAATSLAPHEDWRKAEDMRSAVRGLQYSIIEADKAIREHDLPRFDKALEDFRKAFEPVREAARPR